LYTAYSIKELKQNKILGLNFFFDLFDHSIEFRLNLVKFDLFLLILESWSIPLSLAPWELGTLGLAPAQNKSQYKQFWFCRINMSYLLEKPSKSKDLMDFWQL